MCDTPGCSSSSWESKASSGVAPCPCNSDQSIYFSLREKLVTLVLQDHGGKRYRGLVGSPALGLVSKKIFLCVKNLAEMKHFKTELFRVKVKSIRLSRGTDLATTCLVTVPMLTEQADPIPQNQLFQQQLLVKHTESLVCQRVCQAGLGNRCTSRYFASVLSQKKNLQSSFVVLLNYCRLRARLSIPT